MCGPETRHVAEVAALNEDGTFDTTYLAGVHEVSNTMDAAGFPSAPSYYMCCHYCGACSQHSKDRRAIIAVAAEHIQNHKDKEASNGQEG